MHITKKGNTHTHTHTHTQKTTNKQTKRTHRGGDQSNNMKIYQKIKK
jgi:hypothetical protein